MHVLSLLCLAVVFVFDNTQHFVNMIVCLAAFGAVNEWFHLLGGGGYGRTCHAWRLSTVDVVACKRGVLAVNFRCAWSSARSVTDYATSSAVLRVCAFKRANVR